MDLGTTAHLRLNLRNPRRREAPSDECTTVGEGHGKGVVAGRESSAPPPRCVDLAARTT